MKTFSKREVTVRKTNLPTKEVTYNIDLSVFLCSPFFLHCDCNGRENYRNTRVQTSVPRRLLDMTIYRHVLFLPLFVCDGRVSNPCFPFRLPEIDFRSGILQVTCIVNIVSRTSLQGNCLLSRCRLYRSILHAPLRLRTFFLLQKEDSWIPWV